MAAVGNAPAAASVGQAAVIAAIVATLLYWPAGVALGLLLPLGGLRLDALLTFGGNVGLLLGMLAWWLAFYLAALVYVVIAFPWPETRGFSPQKKD